MALIVGWLVTGPIFRFNDTWQLAINTATTILTFLMVFVIQNTQSRDTQAIQMQLRRFVNRCETLAREARNRLKEGRSDTGTPEP